MNHRFNFRIKEFAKGAYACKVLCIFLMLLMSAGGNSSQAQSVSTSELSVDFKQEKLSTIIRVLSDKSQLSFSYDAKDAVFDQYITYKAVNKPLVEILDEILTETNHTFKQLDRQIVIYIPLSQEADSEDLDDAPRIVYMAIEAEPTKEVTVTRYIIDTLLVIDTVLVRIPCIVWIHCEWWILFLYRKRPRR